MDSNIKLLQYVFSPLGIAAIVIILIWFFFKVLRGNARTNTDREQVSDKRSIKELTTSCLITGGVIFLLPLVFLSRTVGLVTSMIGGFLAIPLLVLWAISLQQFVKNIILLYRKTHTR